MFQSSGHVPEDSYFKYLEAAGSSFVNGSTDFDRTNYLEDVPSNQLELALWLESDRMGFLLDRITAASFANQQDVVRNERRQSVENAPYGLVEEELYHQLFPKTHPYYASVIGSHEDIQNAKVDDVKEFFRRYYVPNNATLVIAGDIDKVKAKALITKYFGSVPRGQVVPRVEASRPPIPSERRSTVTDEVELPRVFMGWITSPAFKAGDAEGGIAADILAGGKASRLYKTLVYEKQIAQDVSVQLQSLQLGSVFELTVTAPPTPPPPTDKEAAVESKEPWRNTVPGAGATPVVKLPVAKRFSLPNGLTVLVVESHRLPIVANTLVLRSGSAQDPENLPGLAGYTSSMLD